MTKELNVHNYFVRRYNLSEKGYYTTSVCRGSVYETWQDGQSWRHEEESGLLRVGLMEQTDNDYVGHDRRYLLSQPKII